MPPVGGPQGSRTALITWSVVFAFLFVLSSVFAIYFYADSTKFKTATGWSPTVTMRDGLARTIAFYRHHLDRYLDPPAGPA